MNSAESSSHSRRPRKVARTYSLTTDGHLYSLISHPGPSNAPLPRFPSLPTPVATPPQVPLAPSSSKTASIQRQMHDMMDYTPTTSYTRLYQPYIPVPRGPRSTNLYLYPPTEADYAQARRRRTRRAAAIDDALTERADDERRRNEVLGISAPRKSTRKIRSKPAIVAATGSPALDAKNAPGIREKRGRKGRKPANPAVLSQPVLGETSISPSNSSVSLQPPSEGLFSNASRRKPRPRLNPRPTPRLTTRSLAKAKNQDGEISAGHSSIVPSEVVDHMSLDVEIGDLRETGAVAFPGVPPPDGGLQLMVVEPALPEMRSEYDSNRASSSVGSSLPSSDTLCEDTESVPLKAADSHTGTAVKDVLPSQTRSPIISAPPIPSTVRIPSPIPMMVEAPPTAAATNTQIGGKKRKREQMDEASEMPPPTQPRRSARVPKKRKLE